MRTRDLPPFNGRVSDKFYVHEFKHWREVEGEPLVIPGFEELDLFLHPFLHPEREVYSISEGMTGGLCAWGLSLAYAKERTRLGLESYGTRHGFTIGEGIARYITEHGLSPRYGGDPDATRREECYAVKVSNTDLKHVNAIWYGTSDKTGEWHVEPMVRQAAENSAERLNQLFYPPHRYTARRYPDSRAQSR